MLPGEIHPSCSQAKIVFYNPTLTSAELLRFSSASHLLKHIPEETQVYHRSTVSASTSNLIEQSSVDLWAGWDHRKSGGGSLIAALENAGEALDLAVLGL